MKKHLMICAMMAFAVTCFTSTVASAQSSVQDVKSWLNDLGMYVGPPNGDLDGATLKAVAQLLNDESVLSTRAITAPQISAIEQLHGEAEKKLKRSRSFSWSDVKLTVNNYNNKRPPRLIGSELVSQIFNRECVNADYGDGRGESDCSNGNVSSAVETTKNFKINSRVRISFDFWIQPNLAVEPVRKEVGRGPFTTDPFHSYLVMFELERIKSIKNHVYDLDVDSRRGVTFLDSNCIRPSSFGSWHRFDFDLVYTNEEAGSLVVKCDDKVIFSRSGFNSALNPFCYPSNGCSPQMKQNYNQPMRLELGAQMRGNGADAKESGLPVFNEIQGDGIMIRYRNLNVAYN